MAAAAILCWRLFQIASKCTTIIIIIQRFQARNSSNAPNKMSCLQFRAVFSLVRCFLLNVRHLNVDFLGYLSMRFLQQTFCLTCNERRNKQTMLFSGELKFSYNLFNFEFDFFFSFLFSVSSFLLSFFNFLPFEIDCVAWICSRC